VGISAVALKLRQGCSGMCPSTLRQRSPLFGITLKNGEFSSSFFIFFTSNLEASPFSRADRDFSEKNPQSSRRIWVTIEIMASGHWKRGGSAGKTSIFSPKWRHHRNNGERASEDGGSAGKTSIFSQKWRHHRNNGERALEDGGSAGKNLDFLAEMEAS